MEKRGTSIILFIRLRKREILGGEGKFERLLLGLFPALIRLGLVWKWNVRAWCLCSPGPPFPPRLSYALSTFLPSPLLATFCSLTHLDSLRSIMIEMISSD